MIDDIFLRGVWFMAKRTLPLLYIHQSKEVETEAVNQEFFYAKKLFVRQKKAIEKPVEKDDTKNVVKIKEMSSGEERNSAAEIEDQANEIAPNSDSEKVNEYPEEQKEILAKLTQVQSISTLIEPRIELKIEGKKYIGTLEKVEEGTVVLKTRTAPYQIECRLSEIQSVRIISL